MKGRGVGQLTRIGGTVVHGKRRPLLGHHAQYWRAGVGCTHTHTCMHEHACAHSFLFAYTCMYACACSPTNPHVGTG